MKVRDVMNALEQLGAKHTRTRGSHRRYESACGRCFTTAGKPGAEMPRGTARKVQRDMARCCGDGWLGV